MYRVYENGKPADCYHFALHPSWKQSGFSTFIEAYNYARRYLGMYAPKDELKLGIPYIYNGVDYITIEKEN